MLDELGFSFLGTSNEMDVGPFFLCNAERLSAVAQSAKRILGMDARPLVFYGLFKARYPGRVLERLPRYELPEVLFVGHARPPIKFLRILPESESVVP